MPLLAPSRQAMRWASWRPELIAMSPASNVPAHSALAPTPSLRLWYDPADTCHICVSFLWTFLADVLVSSCAVFFNFFLTLGLMGLILHSARSIERRRGYEKVVQKRALRLLRAYLRRAGGADADGRLGRGTLVSIVVSIVASTVVFIVGWGRVWGRRGVDLSRPVGSVHRVEFE